MTSNDNTTAQTLLFPIQVENDSARRLQMSDNDLLQQYRLALAEFSNGVATGQITCEKRKEEGRRHIWNVNNILRRNGYKPIEIDF